MTTSVGENGVASSAPARTDWLDVARELGPAFASRAAAYDANDSFPFENYRELKAQGVFGAPVPTELGGGGASYAELCALLTELGRHCSATALSLSMHMHLTATLVWAWRRGGPGTALLERIAAEQLVLVTSGAADWLESSDTAHRVDGGFHVNARKPFCSGSPAGDLLLTSAVYNDPHHGPTVLHFSLPLKTPGVTVHQNWRSMAMRGSGSNDVVLDGVFVRDDAISARRPRGTWTEMWNVVLAVAGPLITSAYLGVAQAARDLTIQTVANKRDDPLVWQEVGEMETALVAAQLATQSMVERCAEYTFPPTVANSNAIAIRKTLATQSLTLTVDKALEAVGGSGLLRSVGLERLVRDIQAAQFHPLQPRRQARFSGRMALDLDPIG